MSRNLLYPSTNRPTYLPPLNSPNFPRKIPEWLTRSSLSHSHSLSISRSHVRNVAVRGKSVLGTKSQVLQSFLGPFLIDLYAAKCADLGIPVLPVQQARFLEAVATHFKERKCRLREMNLGPNSAMAVGRMFIRRPELSYYDLSRNNLGDSGVLELSKNLCKSSSIVHLDLSNNDISPEGASALFSALEDQTSLISIVLASNEGLNRNRLGVSGSAKLGELLKLSSVLTHINVAKTSIGSEGAACIARGLKGNYTVLSLDLSWNGIGATGLGALCKAIVKSSLEELLIANNSIGDEGCNCLASLFIGELGDLCVLESLDLSRNNISSLGEGKLFSALLVESGLSRLKLDGNDFSMGLSLHFGQFLRENNVLRNLSLDSCGLEESGAFRIHEGLSYNKGLSGVSLKHNKISDSGAAYLANALKTNKVLRELDLSDNEIRNKGGLALCAALAVNSSLTTLSLKENHLKNPVADQLIELARKSTSLISINLQLNSIDQRVLIELQEALCKNQQKKSKSIVPALRKQIRTLQHDPVRIEAMNCKLQRVQNEQKRLAKRTSLKFVNFEDAKLEAEAKTIVATQKRQQCREQSQSLNKAYAALQENIVIQGKTAKRTINRLSQQINQTEFEIENTQNKKISMEKNYERARDPVSELVAELKQQLHREQLRHRAATKDLQEASATLKAAKGNSPALKDFGLFLASKKLAQSKREQSRRDFGKSRPNTLRNNL